MKIPSKSIGLPVLLALLTLALYWPATRHEFVNYDDDIYVTANAHVLNGLTWENVRWVWKSTEPGNWHPVTMLSHMLDVQWYGLKPWGHHLTSILFHSVNTALVFLLLRQMTGAVWRSALAAAFFGWHPLHVESVAWVAERKDVLSGFFGLLTLMAYAGYVQAKTVRGKVAAYAGALILFSVGLMCKSMLVTWPCVMLLLDFWPLKRMTVFGISYSGIWSQRGLWKRLLLEKIPFFAASIGVSLATVWAQKHEGAISSMQNLSFEFRTENALISYARYLGKWLCPIDLGVFYPLPDQWSLVGVVLAGGLLLGMTAVAIMMLHRAPQCLMGWLWFLGTLLPVIGLVQVGAQAMADRYTYLPSIGLLILLVWGGFAVVSCWPGTVRFGAAVGVGWALVCGEATRHQLQCWQDSETLWRRAIAVHNPNEVSVYSQLGAFFSKRGQFDKDRDSCREACRYTGVGMCAEHLNLGLGLALLSKGRMEEAIHSFQEALRQNPSGNAARNSLGIIYSNQGRLAEAIQQYQEVVRLSPEDVIARNNLGYALLQTGQIQAAIEQYQIALRLQPDNATFQNNLVQAYFNLGNNLAEQGKGDEAIREYREVLRLKPDLFAAHNNLGNSLLKQGQLDLAIEQFQMALRLQPENATVRQNLKAALEMKKQRP